MESPISTNSGLNALDGSERAAASLREARRAAGPGAAGAGVGFGAGNGAETGEARGRGPGARPDRGAAPLARPRRSLLPSPPSLPAAAPHRAADASMPSVGLPSALRSR
jgi:hypothetical protein